MQDLGSGLRRSPLWMAAFVTPVLMMFLFSFFNLSAPVDPARAMAGLEVGVVNLDTGAGPLRLSDQMLGKIGQSMPFSVAPFESEDAARAALEAGEIAAIITIPADFSSAGTSGGAITVKVLATQHLSPVETQLGSTLGQQLQGGMTAAMAQAPLPQKPTVTVVTELLHAAPNQAALVAPAITTFAVWIGSLVGVLALYLATEQAKSELGATRVAGLRIGVPVVVSVVASLVLALVIAWLAESWAAIPGLWLVLWAGIGAIGLTLAGLVAMFGFWALLALLPLVFYQSVLAGAQAPVAAAPDWLRWVGEAVPFHVLPQSIRAALIGGPDGGFWSAAPVAALFGVVLVLAGTYLWSGGKRSLATKQHG
jgi:hypothetical protein